MKLDLNPGSHSAEWLTDEDLEAAQEAEIDRVRKLTPHQFHVLDLQNQLERYDIASQWMELGVGDVHLIPAMQRCDIRSIAIALVKDKRKVAMTS